MFKVLKFEDFKKNNVHVVVFSKFEMFKFSNVHMLFFIYLRSSKLSKTNPKKKKKKKQQHMLIYVYTCVFNFQQQTHNISEFHVF